MDLHIHTTSSDGEKTPIEILDIAQKIKLEYLSITDHDNCFAYEELENVDIKKHYSGNIIVGTEIMTCFEGTMIEVLGYGVDYKIINQWSRDYYSNEQIEIRDRKIFEKLKNIIKSNSDIKLTESLELPKQIPYTGYFKYMVYNDILKYKENDKFLKKYNINSYEEFLRIGLSKKSSPIYINQEDFLINTKQVVDLIHKAGGLAFLAHLYKYQIDNHINFLQKLVDSKVGLDGIEACYSSFTKEQTKSIENFAQKNNLYLSGGSDYHGRIDRNEKIGYGTEGKRIPKKYIENWYNIIDGGKICNQNLV